MITEKIIYRNHLGEEFAFGDNNAWADLSAVHDYAWNYELNAAHIHSFRRINKQFTIPVRLLARTEDEAIEHKNKLTDITEKDIIAEQLGTLWFGDWYLECYVVSSSKGAFLYDKRYLEVVLQVVSPNGVWVKDDEYVFTHETVREDGLDHPYDYEYDFGASSSNMVEVPLESAFKLVIYGATNTPSVLIGNQRYQVNQPLLIGERIEIDSLKRTIMFFDAVGGSKSVFGKRSKAWYIFEPIPEGVHSVVWEGADQIDVHIYEERSEPEWI